MFEVDDEPVETLHIYLERDRPPRPSLLPIFLSLVALLLIVATSVLGSSQQPVTRAVIRVPAVPLATKTFIAEVPVIPTGVKTYPATTARGVLTITNGSIIAQVIPAGFIIQGVATDSAVYVPAGNANGYGYATVSAHALVSGKSGNFATLAINQVIGSSIYIRNLSAFSGGRDAYSLKFVTSNDRNQALSNIRNTLISKITSLHYPCSESSQVAVSVSREVLNVSLRCQMLTYHIAAFYHVTGVRITGKNLIIDVWFIPRPVHIWVK